MFFWSIVGSLVLFLIFFNGKIAVLFSILLLLICAGGIAGYTKKKKVGSSFWKIFIHQVGRGVGGIVFSAGIVTLHLYLDTPSYGQALRGEESFKPTTRETFTEFGTITDTQKYHKYVFTDLQGQEFLLSTDTSHYLGDRLFVTASLKRMDPSMIFPTHSGGVRKRFSETLQQISSSDFRSYEFNYDTRMLMKGVKGSLYEKQSFLITPGVKSYTIQGKEPEFSPLSFIQSLRANLQKYITTLYGENKEAGLLLGLLIGDKSLIPTEEYTTFVNSGLVHIIAVSGGNIAMVVILLSFLFKRVPFYIRNILIIGFIMVYACICGGDSSVVRATIMGILTLIALFFGREISLRRSLKYACFLLIVISPLSLLYDVGFLLSFSAIIGIVLFQQGMQWIKETYFSSSKKEKSDLSQGKWFQKLGNKCSHFCSSFRKEYCIPTFGASLGTAPILLFFMNGVNVTGVLLNLCIVPLIPVITFYGFFTICIGFFCSREWIFQIEKTLMRIVYTCSQRGAKYAIFMQANEYWTKYGILIVGILFMIRVKHGLAQKTPSDPSQTKPKISSPTTTLSAEEFTETFFSSTKKE